MTQIFINNVAEVLRTEDKSPDFKSLQYLQNFDELKVHLLKNLQLTPYYSGVFIKVIDYQSNLTHVLEIDPHFGLIISLRCEHREYVFLFVPFLTI
jgi:hypothetical protein